MRKILKGKVGRLWNKYMNHQDLFLGYSRFSACPVKSFVYHLWHKQKTTDYRLWSFIISFYYINRENICRTTLKSSYCAFCQWRIITFDYMLEPTYLLRLIQKLFYLSLDWEGKGLWRTRNTRQSKFQLSVDVTLPKRLL